MRRSLLVSLALVLTMTALIVPVTAQEATPGVDTLAANEALIRQYYEAVNAHDLTAFDTLLAPDIIDHNPSTANQPPGRDGIKAAIGALLAAFPDYSVTNEEVIATGDTVVVRSTARGTNTGSLLGIPPTGRPAEFAAIDIWRVANGQLTEVWHVEQLLTVLIQLGLVTPPSAPPAPDMTTSGVHSVVGAWEIDSDAEDDTNPPALVVFNADGTLIELHEREPDGAGAWTMIDENTVSAIIVYHQIDADLALEATFTIQAMVKVTGDTFTAPYTVTAVAPDGTVMGTDQGTATGARIGTMPVTPAGSPAATPTT